MPPKTWRGSPADAAASQGPQDNNDDGPAGRIMSGRACDEAVREAEGRGEHHWSLDSAREMGPPPMTTTCPPTSPPATPGDRRVATLPKELEDFAMDWFEFNREGLYVSACQVSAYLHKCFHIPYSWPLRGWYRLTILLHQAWSTYHMGCSWPHQSMSVAFLESMRMAADRP